MNVLKVSKWSSQCAAWTSESGSHDLVPAADASHQQAGEHDAQNLEGKQSHIRGTYNTVCIYNM